MLYKIDNTYQVSLEKEIRNKPRYPRIKTGNRRIG
jgi:hypothetical protein